MKKLSGVKTILYAILALLCSILPFIAQPYDAHADADSNYSFKSVDINIDVREDKTFEIKEVLTVYFKYGETNTGIIRDIQRVSKTARLIDGKEVNGHTYIAELSEVQVKLDGGDANVTLERYYGGSFYSVKMQKPSGYMESESTHVFELSYIYGMSDDDLRGFDDFTFDILGYAMARTERFNAIITFPQGTDLSNFMLRTGRTDEWQPDYGEEYKVDGNVICVSTGERRAGEGLTLQVILDDGYFKTAFKIRFWYYFIFVFIALAAAGVLLWLAFLFNKKTVAPVEFYPPEGMDIMRFSAVWNAGAKGGDTAALILKWAGMGIIDILPDGKKHFILKVNIEKGKSNTPSDRLAPSEKPYFDSSNEEDYFNTLFSGIAGSPFTFSTKTYKSADKKDKKKLYKITESLINRGNKVPTEALREKFGERMKLIMPFVSLIPMFSIIGYFSILTGSATPLLFCIFMAAGTFVGTEWRKAPSMFILLIFPIAFVGFPYAACYLAFDFIIYDYLKLYFIAPIVWIAGTFILPFIVLYRSETVEKDYGRILGFRNFLLTAELPRIETLFDENPEYFADILPYCMIMGISDKVRKRFASLKLPEPRYFGEDINLNRMRRGWSRASHYGRPPQTGGWSSGGGSRGGGGGHGGSHGGGGGGGGSRGC